MKKSSLAIAILFLIGSALYAQVGINTTGSPPDPSAGLDVSFTNKGFLPPRVALTAINSALPVTAPAIGLLVYNTALAGTAPYNVMAGYYCWDGTKWSPVATPPGANPGDMQYWNGAQWVTIPTGSNGQILAIKYGKPTWGQPFTPCGNSFTVNHIAGTVAPVTKTVIYGTVKNIPGEPTKCWITRNLGASQQASDLTDATEASAGWYWQFNHKQGYKHDGTTRTPNTTWITSNSDPSDWTVSNDPCAIELGSDWRIPTFLEWYNVDVNGGWTNWTGPWNSALKLHAAGMLQNTDGSLIVRGTMGFYYSSLHYGYGTYGGSYLIFDSSISQVNSSYELSGKSLRCVRDY